MTNIKKSLIKDEIQNVINTTNQLLSNNDEWKERYHAYLADIENHSSENLRCRRLFRVRKPLYVYSSISKAKSNKCEYDLRFKGQSIATIYINKDDKILIDTKTETNIKYFGIDIDLQKQEWRSSKARKLRKAFSNLNSDVDTKSPEHELESWLLSEFSKSNPKALTNIQPVKINEQFFQFPTPLKASTSSLESAKQYGGGIDILARIKIKGVKANENSRLVVFEVKDENNKNEPVDKVILQAVAYATFIANLLNEELCWWKQFKINSQHKEIYVSTLMPQGDTHAKFEQMKFMASDDIKLILHTLYIDKDNNKFSGSLTDVIL